MRLKSHHSVSFYLIDDEVWMSNKWGGFRCFLDHSINPWAVNKFRVSFGWPNRPFPSCCLSRFRSESWCSTIEREMSMICIRICNSFPFEWLCSKLRHAATQKWADVRICLKRKREEHVSRFESTLHSYFIIFRGSSEFSIELSKLKLKVVIEYPSQCPAINEVIMK